MPSNIVLDTSFLSALLVKEDVHHKNALETFEQISLAGSTIFLPATVVLELEQLAKALNNNAYYSLVDTLVYNLGSEQIDIDENFLSNCRIVNRAILNKITAIDLTVITAAIIKGAELYTFDAKLNKLISEYF